LSSQRRFEGTNLEALLDEVRESLGDGVQIVAANRVRKGGVGGFFAREYFEVIAEEPETPIDLRPPVRLGRHRREPETVAVDHSRSVPRSVLDLVEERNEEERRFGAMDLGTVDVARDFHDVRDLHSMDHGELYVDDNGVFRASDDPVTWSHSRDLPVDALPTTPPPAPPTRAAHEMALPTRYESQPYEPPRYEPVHTELVHHELARHEAPATEPLEPPIVSTETERFAQILERLAHSTEHQSAPAPPAVDLTLPRVPVAPQAAPAAPSPAAAPVTPVVAAPMTPAPVVAAAAPVAHASHSGAEETIERPEQSLVRLGLPARFVPRGMAGTALRDALTESLARLPQPATLPCTKGVVVAIVGMGARPLLLGRAVSEELGLDPEEVVVATQSEIDGVPAWLQITEPEAADERRRSWRRRDHLTFVAISQPALTTATAWASDTLDRLEPTQLWGLASAGWKPEDVDAWSRRLGGFDMLALDRLVDTVSPASMMCLGLPIGRLDGDDATPHRWADELLERITTPEPLSTATAATAAVRA
jgi:hypothetical protein